ncbi:MAG: hypothetical protein IPL61_09925 [Myxococcales bacterium]|nr:hypothetical protein [Myxococcales bacterium]
MARATRALLIVAALAAGAGVSRGHSPPSDATVDRYLKLTPMGDRVRLAYTVVFGQGPGARVRQRLDRDRDGRVSPAEADVLGRELDRDVMAALTIAIDGQPVRWTWARVDVGLGADTVAAGALSVDLIAWLCTGGGDAHGLTMRDELRLDAMGATELTVERGPGITIAARTLGGERLEDDVASWTGVGGPIATGLELRYAASATATRPRDGRCHADRGAAARRSWLLGFGVGAAAVAALVGGLAWRRRRRR